MKYLALTMFLTIMQAPPPVPRKAADYDAASRRDIKTDAKADKKPASQSKSNGKSEKAKTSPSDETESKDIRKADEQKPIRISELPSVSVKRDWMDSGYLILTGLLVFVTAFTFGAIWWQARETARAAKAAEKSVRLQEVQLRQWVSFDEITSRTKPPFVTGMVETTLVLSFGITNPTKMPLTFKWVIVRFGDELKVQRPEFVLAPDSSYPIEETTLLNGQRIVDYGLYALKLLVVVTVCFEDAFENRRKQVDGAVFTFGPPSGYSVKPYSGKLPEDDIEEQNPN
jgi:hypothetical protein